MGRITSKDKKNLKKIIFIFRPYIKKILFVFIFMLISVAISMIMPLMNKKIMDDGLLKRNFVLVFCMSIGIFLLVLLDELLDLLQTKSLIYISSMIKYKFNSKALTKLFNVQIEYFDENNATEIMKNISMDIDNICKVSDSITLFIITEVLKLIGGIVGLILIDIKLSIIILGVIPIKYIVIKKLTNNRRKMFEKYIESVSDYNSWYGDALLGVREIKLWSIDRIKKREFSRKQRELIKSDVNFAFIDKVNEMTDVSLIKLIISILYIVGAYLIFNSNLTVGSLFAFITYSAYVTNPISIILNIGYKFSSIFPSAERLFNFLEMEEDMETHSIKDDFNFEDIDIEFKNVSFSYKNSNNIIENLSLKINQGEKVLIIGDNGCGKSTLIKIILGLYKPQQGEVLINGINVNCIKPRKYRENFSVVNQDVYIFDGTIKDNISLFSNIKDEKIYDAAEKSGAKEFIEELSMKYETKLGKNGIKLSGGQAQRIAIARAMAKEFKILVLDEATANCDVKSQIYINEILKTSFKDKTFIGITHKIDVELLERVNKIIILEKGRIKDIGTHKDLINRSYYYREYLNKSSDMLMNTVS